MIVPRETLAIVTIKPKFNMFHVEQLRLKLEII